MKKLFSKKKKSKRRKSKGKILRVKQGYNPNSSSMGSIVFVLPAVLLAISVIFGAFAGLLGFVLNRHIDDPGTRLGRFYTKLQNLRIKNKINEELK